MYLLHLVVVLCDYGCLLFDPHILNFKIVSVIRLLDSSIEKVIYLTNFKVFSKNKHLTVWESNLNKLFFYILYNNQRIIHKDFIILLQ